MTSWPDPDAVRLDDGWEAAATPPDACLDPAGLAGLEWRPAQVPGTAAGVLARAGRWAAGEAYDFDAEDWWFRTRFEAAPTAAGEEVLLRLGGIATVAEVYLNGELVLESDSMFVSHAVDVGERLGADNTLAIRCRALKPLLAVRRRPRARWRTRLVADGNLRFFRTMLLGRAPGFAPGPAAVGPWRPVTLERQQGVAVDELALRPQLDGDDGVLAVRVGVRVLGNEPAAGPIEIELEREGATWRAALDPQAADGSPRAAGELRVPDVTRWWPHTHGEPALYAARLRVGERSFDLGRVGFRSLSAGAHAGHDVERYGLDLHVNGVATFARGAVWTPVDAVGLAPTEAELRAALEQVRDAGMNLLRLPGTSAYEERAFFDLCDELGLLVWQDFMFANLDYPIADDDFRVAVEREAREQLGAIAGRPSLAVLCGNSEIEQQVAMLGLEDGLGRGELFGELLPGLARAAEADVPYVPSAPCGGDLAFRVNRGVANYYGVGGYRRPLDDVRRSAVRFASECLAFANVPDEAAIEELLPDSATPIPVHHPRWKAGVPRDVGPGWDFDDVRDHYLQLLFGVDPGELRRSDQARYLELSRAVTGETMAEVFGEWRRPDSPCAGGIVLWLRDLMPGAGWGVVDHRGRPKVAYHHLRRALAPVAVWTTDEGLNGVVAHVANDGPRPLRALLRVALYRDFEQPVGEAQETIEVAAHGAWQRGVEELLGHFVDVGWTFRFGPPAQDLIVVSLRDDRDESLLAQTERFPLGRPATVEALERLGLSATAQRATGGDVRLVIKSRRLAYGVRIHAPGFEPADNAFSVAPGGEQAVLLRALHDDASLTGAALTALNARGRVRLEAPQ